MKNTLSISLATIALAACIVTAPNNAGNDREAGGAMGLIPAPMRVEPRSGECLIGPGRAWSWGPTWPVRRWWPGT